MELVQARFAKKGNRLFIFLALLLTKSTQAVFGQQDDHSQLIKAGIFAYPFEYRYNGFSLHLEMEKSFSKAKSVSTGPRADFVNIKNGSPFLLLGYNMKLYPFFSKQKLQNKGFFIAIAPVFIPKILDVSAERFGPGLSGILGYQLFINSYLSLSAEGNLTYLRDINKHSQQFNANRIYIYNYANVKVGIRLSRWTESKQ